RGAGIAKTRTIDSIDELAKAMPGIAAEDGPSFTLLRVEAEAGFLRTPPMSYEGPEMKYRFGRALEKRFGITVFGPQGYCGGSSLGKHPQGHEVAPDALDAIDEGLFAARVGAPRARQIDREKVGEGAGTRRHHH